MIRIIAKEVDVGDVVHGGGQPIVEHRTFDVELPEVEAWLCEFAGIRGYEYVSRQVIGIELRAADKDSNG